MHRTMSGITTHVLDTARGKPAAGVHIELAFKLASGEWREVGRGATDADGRLRTLVPDGVAIEAGTYRITFDTGAEFDALVVAGFYPEASITFVVRNAAEHFHVPLLLQPFGYATYRGSGARDRSSGPRAAYEQRQPSAGRTRG